MCKKTKKPIGSQIASFYFGYMTATFLEHNTYAGCDSRTTRYRPVKEDPCQLWEVDVIRPVTYKNGKEELTGRYVINARIHGITNVNDLLRFQVQLQTIEGLIRDEMRQKNMSPPTAAQVAAAEGREADDGKTR